MKPDVPVLSKKDYEVRPAPLWVAQDLVEKYHYAKGGSNTAVYVHGLYRKDDLECLGVAWWLPPTKVCAIKTYPEGDWTKVLALSRLVVLPEVPQNGASFLIGESIKRIRRIGDWDCLVTFADLWRGHGGAIYKATNWKYLEETEPTDVWVNSDGRMVSRKAGPKTRTKQQMLDLGCTMVGSFPKHKYRMVLSEKREGLCGTGLLQFVPEITGGTTNKFSSSTTTETENCGVAGF
jgi:hypothetical protein